MNYANNLTTFLKDNPTEREKEVAKLLVSLVKKYRKAPDIMRWGAIPRSRISDDKLTHDDLINAGFKESLIAVPETGQDELITYRHPRSGLHFHKHQDSWLYHEDKHPALQMVMERYRQDNPDASLLDTLKYMGTKALPNSFEHIVHEGLPGWVRWFSGTLGGSKGFNGSDTKPDLLKAGVHMAVGTGTLTLLDHLLSKGTTGFSTAPENFAGLASFVGGNSLATYLYKKMVKRDPKNARPGWKSTALLTGVPIMSALIGKFGVKALINHINKS